MKSRTFPRLLVGIVFLGILIYFGLQIRQYYADPFATTIAYYYETEDIVTVSGFVVREEEVLSDIGSLYSLSRAEGEKVGMGQKIATVYQTQEALDRAEELAALELRLEQLEFAQEAALSSEAALKLDSEILQDLFALHSKVTSGSLDTVDATTESLRSLVLKRDYTYTEGADYTTQIESTQKEIAALEKKSGGDTSTVTAPRSGLYSAVVDGYETVLTPESIMTLTPSTLDRVTPAAASGIGKMIYGDVWYYAAKMKTADAQPLYVGGSATLRFAKGLEDDTRVTVKSISAEENGYVVVVFSCAKHLSDTTLLRAQSADIISEQYSGIRIPKNALRVGEDGETGIYCRSGLFARYKPVKVLYTGSDFCLVEGANTSSSAVATLREGDEVIVTAVDLYDGKVVG